MSSFEVAWSLIKEWTPSWRDVAENELPMIDDISVFDMESQKHRDPKRFGKTFTQKGKNPHQFLGDGQDFMVYAHPEDSRFAVKLPKNPQGETLDYYRNEAGQNFYRDMERMGFPIASEMSMSDGNENEYLVQPLLERQNLNYSPELPNKNVAHFALDHAVGDINGEENWRYDQKGNIRYLDLDTEKYGYSIEDFEDGEENQERLDRHQIQIPARRLLDSMDRHDHDDSQYRRYLEDIEPHSDNPRSLRVKGKAAWLQGY